MPISVTCPECDAPYRISDDMAGKAIKCKKCGGRVPVPVGNSELGSRARPKAGGGDTAGEGGEPKKGGMGKILAIVGAVVVLLGCCVCLPGGGTGVWYFFFRDGSGGGGTITVGGGDKKGTIKSAGEKHDFTVKLEK